MVEAAERSSTMGNKDFDRDNKKQQQKPQAAGGERKNNEEVGEPVQLDEKTKQGQQDKPGMGQREGQQGGQHQGGGQQGAEHQGGQHNR
jgi:hypothetical protein